MRSFNWIFWTKASHETNFLEDIPVIKTNILYKDRNKDIDTYKAGITSGEL